MESLSLESHTVPRALEQFPVPSHTYEAVTICVYFSIIAILSCIPLLLGGIHSPRAGGWALIGIIGYGQVQVLILILSTAIVLIRFWRRTSKPPLHSVQFAILIPMFNEDASVFEAGLESINTQPQAQNTTMIIALEARAGEESNLQREQDARRILTNVKTVHFFRHPDGLQGHVRGCGSNQAWAMNQFMETTTEDVSEWVFIKVDAQVILQHEFLTELEYRMDDWKKNRKPVIWLPLVLHTINNDRVYGVGSAYAQIVEIMTIGLFNNPCIRLFPFGQYCMPLEQYVRAGMHHPSMQAEDAAIGLQCRWTNSQLVFDVLNSAVAKAPPLGDSCIEAWHETWAQDNRFFVGSVLGTPWCLKNNPRLLDTLSFLFNQMVFRHYLSFGLPFVSILSSIGLYAGIITLPYLDAGEGIIILIGAIGFLVGLVGNLGTAALSYGLIAQWPGRTGQVPWKTMLSRALIFPVMTTSLFLLEVRAALLCIVHGSGGQNGPLTYRARKKVGAARPQPLADTIGSALLLKKSYYGALSSG